MLDFGDSRHKQRVAFEPLSSLLSFNLFATDLQVRQATEDTARMIMGQLTASGARMKRGRVWRWG